MMAGAGPLARSAAVLAAAVVVHVGLGVHLTPVGVIVDPFLLAAVVGGIVGGRGVGASFGGGCGLASDLIAHTPFGMWMLVLTLVGYAAGSAAEQLPDARRLARSAMAAVLAAGGIWLFVGIGWLLDLAYVIEAPVLRIAVVTALAALSTHLITERVLRWALVIRPAVTVPADPGQGPPSR